MEANLVKKNTTCALLTPLGVCDFVKSQRLVGLKHYKHYKHYKTKSLSFASPFFSIFSAKYRLWLRVLEPKKNP